MNISGILVVAGRDHLTEVVAALNGLPGVEVHQVEAETGRLIVTHEAADIHAEIEGIRRIKALPHVVMAEMVYHYIAEDERVYEAIPPELNDQACAVPAYLNT